MKLQHFKCPECGSVDIVHDVAEWPAYSAEDPTNTARLIEFQCSECGRSVWLGPDVLEG